jgi:hypothetical protein
MLEVPDRVTQRMSEIQRQLCDLVDIAPRDHLIHLAEQDVGVLGRPRLRQPDETL